MALAARHRPQGMPGQATAAQIAGRLVSQVWSHGGRLQPLSSYVPMPMLRRLEYTSWVTRSLGESHAQPDYATDSDAI